MSITIPDAIVAAMRGEGFAELHLHASSVNDEWSAWVLGYSASYGSGCIAATPQAALDALAAELEAHGD